MAKTEFGAINTKTGFYTLPDLADRDDEFICIGCAASVFLRKGEINAAHFAHYRDDSSCGIYAASSDQQTHKRAQLILKHILESKFEMNLSGKCNTCKETWTTHIPERCDVGLEVHLEHRFEYNGLKIADLAQLKDGEIFRIFEIYNTHKTRPDARPEPWFELDATAVITAFHARDSQPIHLTCVRDICEGCLTQDPHETKEEPSEPGIIYFNQRGAGCGKTYESIQLIQSDPRFAEKNAFIYLTKMHSAKEVIHNELQDQTNRGQLSDLSMTESDASGKQYKISFRKTATNTDIRILIGTIDSFTFSVVDKREIVKCKEYFEGIVKTLILGHTAISESGMIKYAGERAQLTKRCLIVIDEAQDLGVEYIRAFSEVITQTNIDVYVIGDKLQSILSDQNIHTFVDKNNLGNPVERSAGINKVMRFHNTQFIEFVNQIVPFESHGLPQITEICGGNCRYTHDNHIKPYAIFEIPTVYANECDKRGEHKMDKIVNKIIQYMELEIAQHNYLPNNFMFIFPILKGNTLAMMLEERIQDFWIGKFNNDKYQEVLNKDGCFWKDKIGDNEFYKYIYFHKSEEGKSINLKESENASRILSIHASKGNGCEVVFVLGLTERALLLFSKKKGNLVYESLLHVAITRQKKALYIGLEANNDDIHSRFRKFDVEHDDEIIPNISHIDYYGNECGSWLEFLKVNDNVYTNLDANIVDHDGYRKLIPQGCDKESIIDWGHHAIRHAIMVYVFMQNVVGNLADPAKDQFITVVYGLRNCSVEAYQYGEYIKKLRKISKSNRDRRMGVTKNAAAAKPDEIMTIPLLRFDINGSAVYGEYTKTLKKIITNIQEKIKKVRRGELPVLCALECLVLYFMLNITQKGIQSEISVMDIYSVMYCYNSCSNEITESHGKTYGCVCLDQFKKGRPDDKTSYSEIRKSIKHHYDNIEKVGKIYSNYSNFIVDEYHCKTMKYNVFHRVGAGDPQTFEIRDRPDIIGYSDTHVIYFIIKPQFNELNFNDIMMGSILQSFMLERCPQTHRNYARYNGKKKIMCIITLDSEAPIFYSINTEIHNEQISASIKKWLFEKYSCYSDVLYRFYEYHRKLATTAKKGVIRVRDEIHKIDAKYPNGNPIPTYIKKFFDKIVTSIKCEKDKARRRIALKPLETLDTFSGALNKELDLAIDEFLGQCDSDSDTDSE